LDLMIFEVFSNLNDSMNLRFFVEQRSQANGRCPRGQACRLVPLQSKAKANMPASGAGLRGCRCSDSCAAWGRGPWRRPTVAPWGLPQQALLRGAGGEPAFVPLSSPPSFPPSRYALKGWHCFTGGFLTTEQNKFTYEAH